MIFSCCNGSINIVCLISEATSVSCSNTQQMSPVAPKRQTHFLQRKLSWIVAHFIRYMECYPKLQVYIYSNHGLELEKVKASLEMFLENTYCNFFSVKCYFRIFIVPFVNPPSLSALLFNKPMPMQPCMHVALSSLEEKLECKCNKQNN